MTVVFCMQAKRLFLAILGYICNGFSRGMTFQIGQASKVETKKIKNLPVGQHSYSVPSDCSNVMLMIREPLRGQKESLEKPKL